MIKSNENDQIKSNQINHEIESERKERVRASQIVRVY